MKKKRRATHPTHSAGASYQCPWCGEAVDTCPDPGGGESQSYVEDCALCCRPNVLTASWDEASGEWTLDAARE
jgi:hypothetical protein